MGDILNKDKQKTKENKNMNINSRPLPILESLIFICLLIMSKCFYGIIRAMETLIRNGIIKNKSNKYSTQNVVLFKNITINNTLN